MGCQPPSHGDYLRHTWHSSPALDEVAVETIDPPVVGRVKVGKKQKASEASVVNPPPPSSSGQVLSIVTALEDAPSIDPLSSGGLGDESEVNETELLHARIKSLEAKLIELRRFRLIEAEMGELQRLWKEHISC